MSWKNVLAAIVIVVAMAVPLSGASVVKLEGGCPLYVINASSSYITFNVVNAGNGTASDLLVSATFPGVSSRNETVMIPNVVPNTTYSRQFHLDSIVGQGSYAVNINATYVQAGSNYATVFPCIIYLGRLAGGPLEESVSIVGNRMAVNITNTAPQSIEAQVDAIVPPSFSVVNSTKPITVKADGHATLSFDIVSPTYTDATFPVIGELSYEYNGTHYAQMGSAALVFGAGGISKATGNGIGLVGWILVIIIVVIIVLIVASLFMKQREKERAHSHHIHHDHEKKHGEPK